MSQFLVIEHFNYTSGIRKTSELSRRTTLVFDGFKKRRIEIGCISDYEPFPFKNLEIDVVPIDNANRRVEAGTIATRILMKDGSFYDVRESAEQIDLAIEKLGGQTVTLSQMAVPAPQSKANTPLLRKAATGVTRRGGMPEGAGARILRRGSGLRSENTLLSKAAAAHL